MLQSNRYTAPQTPDLSRQTADMLETAAGKSEQNTSDHVNGKLQTADIMEPGKSEHNTIESINDTWSRSPHVVLQI